MRRSLAVSALGRTHLCMTPSRSNNWRTLVSRTGPALGWRRDASVRIASSMIGRDRVESPMTGPDAPRLVSLIAGAGAGKTTLISSVADPQHWVVHAVSSADRSVSVFARNVVRRLRLLVPGLSAELWMAIDGASGAAAGSDGVAESLAAAIALDLDGTLRRDLVLDDLHEIDGSRPSERSVADRCRHAPARLRVVLASRSPLPFPTARLRLTNEHREMDADELTFTVVVSACSCKVRSTNRHASSCRPRRRSDGSDRPTRSTPRWCSATCTPPVVTACAPAWRTNGR